MPPRRRLCRIPVRRSEALRYWRSRRHCQGSVGDVEEVKDCAGCGSRRWRRLGCVHIPRTTQGPAGLASLTAVIARGRQPASR